MKWLGSLFRAQTAVPVQAVEPPVVVDNPPPVEAGGARQILCACCGNMFKTEGTLSPEKTLCGNCGADATQRLMMAVVRYSTRLLIRAGQTALLVEAPAAIRRQFTDVEGLTAVITDFSTMSAAATADALETPDAVIMTRFVTGDPAECDAIQNIYGLLRSGGWLLMHGTTGYFAEQAGFTVYENTAARIELLPQEAAAGLNSEEKVLFCLKQRGEGRATNPADKERAELRARYAPDT